MKELKTLKLESNITDFYDCYNYNKKLIGPMSIKEEIYFNFIKILCIFPLKDKKLNYFINLDAKSKVGFMSSYLMKVARLMNVPNSIIEHFKETKDLLKHYKENKKSAKEIGELYYDDSKKFLNEYSYVIKEDVYSKILSKMTTNLCESIFEQYDKAKKQILKG